MLFVCVCCVTKGRMTANPLFQGLSNAGGAQIRGKGQPRQNRLVNPSGKIKGEELAYYQPELVRKGRAKS